MLDNNQTGVKRGYYACSAAHVCDPMSLTVVVVCAHMACADNQKMLCWEWMTPVRTWCCPGGLGHIATTDMTFTQKCCSSPV